MATDTEHGIELITSNEDLVWITLECTYAAKERLDLFGDRTMAQFIVEVRPILEAYRDLARRGGKIRFVTEITKENIAYCKEFVKFSEVRHLDELMVGGWGVTELDYIAAVPANSAKEHVQPVQGLHSKMKEVLKLQKYVIESLWEKAIPAAQRIKEIGQGVVREFIEIRKEKADTEGIYRDVLKNAKTEILVVFPNARLLGNESVLGLKTMLDTISSDRGIKVKILTPVDDTIKQAAMQLRKQHSQYDISIRSIEPDLRTKILVLIVDRKYALAIELKDEKEIDAGIGLSSYSNSAATVLTYSSVFESLWKQSEMYEHIHFLYEQLSKNDKMQKEFINITAHELRNPIQPIIGLAKVLRGQADSNPQQRILIDAILRSAKRLQSLQEDILDVTRIESGLLKLKLTRFNLNKTILDLLKDFDHDSGVRRISRGPSKARPIFRSKPGSGIFVYADKERITQVLSNLSNNAAKFGNGGRISVQVGATRLSRSASKMTEWESMPTYFHNCLQSLPASLKRAPVWGCTFQRVSLKPTGARSGEKTTRTEREPLFHFRSR